MTHRDLNVWKKGVDLVILMYKVTEDFPKSENYGLKIQIRRASVSVPANISEGAAKFSSKEFLRYLKIAYGSLSELETHLIISERLGYIDASKTINLKVTELRKMLFSLIKSIQNKTMKKG